ncbi:NAD(P)H-binding protein [Frankia sp. CNm7]|uniref:NAD(P)H-binding protein n=1 Tax=Frankia nepalensis TaxID=1836974 RepID=A0A937RTF5_9ACTN|nr:NAD(P)H-binding protein [Frankia nepalensis]MBL7502652.1 NAD(P)H-binding protein [Frankia nepalensis]MBL7514878.1 NAD(P)H-binding protein [Frankia nepalensis]MBL7524623.1 NAD(P)H-binding protein [Frankia nepalensis]MBL7633024.1 NAD(P)H-binding protein [Frankia nepalensis]
MNIVVFGAGGRAGRQVLAEARRRGHEVTAVVRDPARHGDLPSDVQVVAGDVMDAVSVERAAAGQDAVISAAADLSTPAHDFFTASSRALITGLGKAGVRRLVVVGLSSVLPGASGAPLMDEPGYPNEYRSFSLGHAAGLDVLRTCELDWAYVAPAGDFDHDGARTGQYKVAEHGDPASRIGYADFAIALLDEIEQPRHHRATVSVQ